MNVLIFSLGEKGFSVVKALVESERGHVIHCVIGQDSGVEDDYSSRLITFCENCGIGHSSRATAAYEVCDYDFFIAVGWRWIIKNIPPEKLIILHDSLLPRYRGFAPLVNALINKEKRIGVTALLGADEYDKGNILLQHSIEVKYPTRIDYEMHRIADLYANLAVELFVKLDDESLDKNGSPQNEVEASYSLWRDDDDYRIDWSDSASNIEHFVSCVGSPYRGASAVLNGALVRILKAQAMADVKIENRTPGKVIFLNKNLPVVVCGMGLILLHDIKTENGESMLPLKNFRSKFF